MLAQDLTHNNAETGPLGLSLGDFHPGVQPQVVVHKLTKNSVNKYAAAEFLAAATNNTQYDKLFPRPAADFVNRLDNGDSIFVAANPEGEIIAGITLSVHDWTSVADGQDFSILPNILSSLAGRRVYQLRSAYVREDYQNKHFDISTEAEAGKGSYHKPVFAFFHNAIFNDYRGRHNVLMARSVKGSETIKGYDMNGYIQLLSAENGDFRIQINGHQNNPAWIETLDRWAIKMTAFTLTHLPLAGSEPGYTKQLMGIPAFDKFLGAELSGPQRELVISFSNPQVYVNMTAAYSNLRGKEARLAAMQDLAILASY